MRKVLRYLAGLFFVGAIVLAAISGYAHWQIRSIEPALPSWVQLDARLRETGGPVSAAYINTSSQTSTMGELGHPAIVITWADGRRFLIDTGMPPAAALQFGKSLELLGASTPETFGGVAEQMGAAVDTVKGIAFTHLHNDHTEGLPGLCAAQTTAATVFQTPLQFDVLNYTTRIGLPFLEMADCPRAVLGQETIKSLPGFPGLVAVSLGGHTPGSTMYAVRVGRQTWIFSGDITNSRQAMLQDLPKPWWYSTLVVPEYTERTAQLRRWLRLFNSQQDVAVLPAHDVLAMAAAGLRQWPDLP